MSNYMTIAEYVSAYPDEPRFKVFRVFDGYMFTVKEVRETTVILNTHVNLEVDQDSDEYRVHESSLGLDYSLPKVFRYAPDSMDKPVQALNFRKELNTRLHNCKDWKFGRLLRECFHPFGEDLRTVDEDDLIVQVTYDYEFDSITKEATYRLETITWFDENGEVVYQKPQPKIYVGHEGMGEAETRRKNIINFLKHDLDSMSKGSGDPDLIAATQALIGAIDPYINLYIKYGSYAVVSFLGTYDNVLLDNPVAVDVTVRQYMISTLDFLTAEAADVDLYKGSLL